MPKKLSAFLDTSVIFAAVLSASGGARQLFQLGEAGLLTLQAGPRVLRECDEVVRRKAPLSLARLARLLEAGRVEITPAAGDDALELARRWVAYPPDAYVLAEAICAGPDWLVTHDRAHFLKERGDLGLAFRIGTPGDPLQAWKAGFLAG